MNRTKKPPGKMASAMSEALDTYQSLIAQGMPREDAVKLLEDGLRAIIPGDNEPPPVYACGACQDSGYMPVTVYMKIYREERKVMRFCFCAKGRAFKDSYDASESDRKAHSHRRGGMTSIADAVKTNKPGGWK